MQWSKGYIYIVKAENGLYKMGHAANVEKRIRKLPFRVELIHSISADNALQAEGTLHERYRKNLVGGEWFRFSAEEVEKLKQIIHIPEISDSQPKFIAVGKLSSSVVDSLNSQAAHLGFKSRERYLRALLTAIADSSPAIIEQIIKIGAIDDLVEAAGIRPHR